MKNKKVGVMVAVLVGSENTIHMSVAHALNEIVAGAFRTKKYEPTMRFSRVNGVEYNRNQIVYTFLNDTDCEYLLMIDDDNPPLKNPLELIDLDLDVISLPTFMWRADENFGSIAYNQYKIHKDKNGKPDGWVTMVYSGKELEEVDRCGSGCILIHRRVLEKLDVPFESQTGKHGLRHLGEDILFSDKVRKLGFKLWTHWNYPCSHYKVVDLMSIAQSLLKEKYAKQDAEVSSKDSSDTKRDSKRTKRQKS